ncbi:MAG: redoxin domain-containing protein [Planctomycetota bacterium]
MKSTLRILGLILLLTATVSPVFAQTGATEPFELRAVSGEQVLVEATDNDEFVVLCFLGNECPLAKLYAPRLNSILRQFEDRPVRFVAVNSNYQDSVSEIESFAETFELAFPICKDGDNRVADIFGATRTPEVFVIDGNLQVQYRGRIDDQYGPGQPRSAPSETFLVDALTALLEGNEPEVTETEAVGCIIGRRREGDAAANAVTYCNQISRMLQNHCVECHREGQIGPFEMTDYDEVVGWADMMLETIDDKRMPPWHADPDYGDFANARHLPDEARNLLSDWIDAGTPYGDEAMLPEPVEFVDGWRLPREPDIVLEMRDRPFNVPAEGTVEYQYFVVDPGFDEDKWVMAAEVVPGNYSVVHHSIVFVRPPDGELDFRGSGWLSAYVPGQGVPPFDETMARRIPAGSKLVFQQHYTPTGVEAGDITSIGLVFADPEKVTHEQFTLMGIDQDFEIPPHADAHAVECGVERFPRNGMLLSVAPHMHWRGKSFEFRMSSGGEEQVMLRVPAYDFNWQHDYQFVKPISLDEVDALNFTMTFDNSEGNRVNPDPSRYVTWGDQTWEEMVVAFFNVARPISDDSDFASSVETSEEDEQRVAEMTDRFFRELDVDNDGFVSEAEAPRAIRAFRMWRYDTDDDRMLSREEVEAQMWLRLR